MSTTDPLFFNGLDPRTGTYLFAPQSIEQIARTLVGDDAAPPASTANADDPDALEQAKAAAVHDSELKQRATSATMKHLGVIAGVDVTNLAETGWGAVFPFVKAGTEAAARQQAILDALAPLLDLRRSQAGKRYRLYTGTAAMRPPETKVAFLSRHGMGPGPADPERVPYYLLIVAGPDEIAFSVQYQLDVQYAVGRIHFDSIDDYAAYARSVVAAETGGLELAREVATFAVANPDDPATQLSSTHLVGPLVDRLAPRAPDWTFTRYAPERATKSTLAGLLSGDAPPAVLFTASHGAGFQRGDPLQRRHQGALVCQDWPGPVKARGKPIPTDHYFSADDLASTASPHGAIVFNFACYGAGTPRYNDYGQRTAATAREAIADAPFMSALHQRLLSLPRGGALAAVGHVERAWGCSFLWPGTGGRTGSPAQLAVFESALRQLLGGYPIGAALEWFNQRYAELSSDLSHELEEISFGRTVDELALADMWTANNDARGYAITGDPAVRIPVAPPGGASKRVDVERIVLHTATVAADPEPTTPAAPEPATTEPARPAAASKPYVGFSTDGALTSAELARVFGDDGVLTVRTYVTDDPEAATPERPLVVTRLAFDADVDHALSSAAEAPASAAALQLHTASVRGAQAHRVALLTALAAARRQSS